MAFDFEALKKNLQKSTEILQKTVTEASGKLAESVKDVQTSKTVKEIVQKSQSAFTTLKTKGEEVITQQRDKNARYKEAILEAVQHQSERERILSIQDSLRLIYCLMIVDGTVSNEEQITFCDIGRELDPEFESYQGLLIEEGSHLMHMPSENEDEYYDNIHDHVSNIIYSASIPKEKGIRGKVLLWNLLTVAFSEGEYSANEKRLLRYITKCVNVDYAVFLEMEYATRTLLAISNEENWLKNTDRGQMIIDERLKELLVRKETIMIEVHELFSD